jgi:chorismate-pyruvate lyase
MDSLARQLLDHRCHMTVTIEDWIQGAVAVAVLRERTGETAGRGVYAREILLSGAFNGEVRALQYGIVRIDLATVPEQVAEAIRAGTIPMGRILIAADVHRDIQDVALVSVTAARGLAAACGLPEGSRLPGRVATILLGSGQTPSGPAVFPGSGGTHAAGRGENTSGKPQAAARSETLVPAVELLEVLIPLAAPDSRRSPDR